MSHEHEWVRWQVGTLHSAHLEIFKCMRCHKRYGEIALDGKIIGEMSIDYRCVEHDWNSPNGTDCHECGEAKK